MQRAGLEAVTAPDSVRAAAMMHGECFELAILDRLPETTVAAEVARCRARSSRPSLLLLTTRTSASPEGSHHAVDAYVPQPFHIIDLDAQIDRLLAGRPPARDLHKCEPGSVRSRSLVPHG